MYSPIALFVYNRPAHTRQTVEALQKNSLAKDSDLTVYSDAPKNAESEDAVRQVRQYIHQITGFKSVTIVEREKNWGLANSIIDGVTKLVNEYGRIIVLEDDLVTSPYFLSYMNEALEYFQHEEKVMHVSGYMFPIVNANLPETFFLRTASCWGWATWSRAWQYFENDPDKLHGDFTEQSIKRFNLDGAYNFWVQVEKNRAGLMNSWAVFWYASIFKKNGLCLHPKFSMVSNIGHDDSGLHCGKTDRFDVQLAKKPVVYYQRNITENVLVLERLKAYFSPAKPSLFARIILAIRRRFFTTSFNA
jgi:hypothetical protein